MILDIQFSSIFHLLYLLLFFKSCSPINFYSNVGDTSACSNAFLLGYFL